MFQYYLLFSIFFKLKKNSHCFFACLACSLDLKTSIIIIILFSRDCKMNVKSNFLQILPLTNDLWKVKISIIHFFFYQQEE